MKIFFLYMRYTVSTGLALLDDVELASNYFLQSFTNIVNKHAPFRKFRVNGGKNL